MAVLLACGLTGACSGVPEVQRLSRYESLLERPLAERVLPADESVIERAYRTNLKYGDDVRPRAASAQHPLAPLVRQALADLPPAVARLAERYLCAVYLLEDDLGTATSEGVADAAGNWRHAYIALNLSALGRDANAWASWKEQSAFRPSTGYDLRVTLEPPGSDDRLGAIRFILLHELGHVLGLGLGIHGFWDDPDPAPALTRKSAFVALSWQLVDEGPKREMGSRYARRFPALGGLGFYRFAEAPNRLDEAPALYAALSQTNFPSLYGTLQLYDDFAETFAIYVHTALLRKPYRVEVLHNGAVASDYASCLLTRRCEDKLAAIQAVLDRAPSGPQLHLGVGGGIGIGTSRRR